MGVALDILTGVGAFAFATAALALITGLALVRPGRA
jgi:hypothetical protein